MGDDPREKREGRGRSEKKRAAQAVAELAVRLVGAGTGLCERLPMPEKVREELILAQRITAHGARKRQIKHLADLLRRDEATASALREALDAAGRSALAERKFFHHLEQLRDGLCDPDLFAESLNKAASELPGLDRRLITRLARKVHQTGEKRASREIFRRLRALAEGSSEE